VTFFYNYGYIKIYIYLFCNNNNNNKIYKFWWYYFDSSGRNSLLCINNLKYNIYKKIDQ